MLVEIACDESGYEGDKLIGTTTDVFAHASVRLDLAAAAGCVGELRARIRSPALEYKANHLLREKHRAVLEWLLGPTSPVYGRARVYLVDKALHVVTGVAGPLLADPAAVAALHRDGPAVFGPERWAAFLVAANDLLRTRDRLDVRGPVERFLAAVDALAAAGAAGPVGDTVARLRRAGHRAEAWRSRLAADPELVSPLDPLPAAIARAVAYWGEGGEPVFVVHDRQNTLSPARVARLAAALGPGRLADLTLVGSGADPRVQVADILAGAARKIASDALNAHPDPILTALLHPYLDPLSIWAGAFPPPHLPWR
ncbi:MAG: hypothetical protein ACJ73S_22920 [Mycobacteriales bacterium]